MVVGACILSILCSTFVTVTSMLANFRYQSLHISHTVQSRRLQRTPLLREKSIYLTSDDSERQRCAHGFSPSKGHKDNQGIICIRVSHRVGVQ